MNFDHLDYEERVKAIKEYIRSQQEPWMESIEVQLYEEQQKNREYNDRIACGLIGGAFLTVVFTLISILFPSFLADTEYLAVIGKFAIAFFTSYYLLYPFVDGFFNRR